MRSRTIESAHFDSRKVRNLFRWAVGRDQHMSTTRGRPDNDRTPILCEPRDAAVGGADDLDGLVSVPRRRRYQYDRQHLTRDLAIGSGRFADLNGIKTLVEPQQPGRRS